MRSFINRAFSGFLIVFAVVGFVCSCAGLGLGASGQAEDVIEVVSEENGFRASTAGRKIVIRIKGNPTTGYSWGLEENSDYEGCLEFDEVQYEAYTAAEGLVGRGGEFVFAAHAVKSGVYTLHFVYRRPWETEGIRTLDVVVSADRKLVPTVQKINGVEVNAVEVN